MSAVLTKRWAECLSAMLDQFQWLLREFCACGWSWSGLDETYIAPAHFRQSMQSDAR